MGFFSTVPNASSASTVPQESQTMMSAFRLTA
jgi:hypothetical protein